MADHELKKIFVGGLPAHILEEELRAYFSEYGAVAECYICYDAASKRPRGFGFVAFENEKVTEALCDKAVIIDGKPVECRLAVPKNDPGAVVNTEKRVLGAGIRLNSVPLAADAAAPYHYDRRDGSPHAHHDSPDREFMINTSNLVVLTSGTPGSDHSAETGYPPIRNLHESPLRVKTEAPDVSDPQIPSKYPRLLPIQVKPELPEATTGIAAITGFLPGSDGAGSSHLTSSSMFQSDRFAPSFTPPRVSNSPDAISNLFAAPNAVSDYASTSAHEGLGQLSSFLSVDPGSSHSHSNDSFVSPPPVLTPPASDGVPSPSDKRYWRYQRLKRQCDDLRQKVEEKIKFHADVVEFLEDFPPSMSGEDAFKTIKHCADRSEKKLGDIDDKRYLLFSKQNFLDIELKDLRERYERTSKEKTREFDIEHNVLTGRFKVFRDLAEWGTVNPTRKPEDIHHVILQLQDKLEILRETVHQQVPPSKKPRPTYTHFYFMVAKTLEPTVCRLAGLPEPEKGQTWASMFQLMSILREVGARYITMRREYTRMKRTLTKLNSKIAEAERASALKGRSS